MISSWGKLFIVAGILFIIVGLFMHFGVRIPFIGRLPGDILIRKKQMTLYFPVMSCIVLSIILSLLIKFFKHRS